MSMPPQLRITSPQSSGIGILFVNPQVQPVQTIYIRAQLSQALSVLMAEAAALALAAIIADRLHYNNVTFLSDCQWLVHFLNSTDLTNPPEWQIKHYTPYVYQLNRYTSSQDLQDQ
jgi:hypothetical protein